MPGTVEPDRFASGENVGDPDAMSLVRVACRLAGARAFYKCEHEDGAVSVLLHDERIDATPALDAPALTAAFVRSVGMAVYESSQRELSFELPTGELMALAVKKYADGGRSMSFDVAR